MKTLILILILTLPAVAQDPAGLAAAGCGGNEVQFDVKLDKKQHPLAQLEPGKALVYVIEENTECLLCSTYRVGLDGVWVGATHGNSYFFFAVEPGDHRLCTAVQPWSKSRSDLASAASLTAEAGKVYYFRTRFHERQRVKLELIDSAEGQLLIATKRFKFSNSHPRK